MSKKSYSLKKLQIDDAINKYEVIENQENIVEQEEIIKKEEELRNNNRELAIQRLKEKQEASKNARLGRSQSYKKSNPQENALNQMMNHPSFSNLDMNDENAIKQVIEQMASKMTNDGKQKKQMKKKMNDMLNKIKKNNNN